MGADDTDDDDKTENGNKKKGERAAHDNKSKYIVFNMSMNANVNTSELSNGHNHTEFTYCRVSDIYIFVSFFFSLVET